MLLSPVMTNTITEDIDVLAFLPQNNSYLFSRARVEPAILYAQQRLETGGGQYSGFRFNIKFENSDCVNDAMFKLLDRSCGHKPDLILGPACEYEAAAVVRLASHWNIPVISAGALAAGFSNKNTEYSHLTRIAPSYVKMAETFTAMFEHFTWRSALLVYEDDKEERSCYFTLEGIYHLMADFNIKTHAHSQGERLDTDDILQNIYDTEGNSVLSLSIYMRWFIMHSHKSFNKHFVKQCNNAADHTMNNDAWLVEFNALTNTGYANHGVFMNSYINSYALKLAGFQLHKSSFHYLLSMSSRSAVLLEIRITLRCKH